MSKKILPLFFLSFLLPVCLYGQSTRIDLGPDEIALNQAFTITITVENERLKSYSGFPEIKGFVKRGTSSSSSTNFTNGQRSSSQSIIQNYVPTAEGDFLLTPFDIKINAKKVRSRGKKIKVGPALQQQRRRNDPFGNDPFQDPFGRNNKQQEFVDVKADAFLAVSTDKNEVYPGEGFTITVAFYVSDKNKADMRFYELSKQIPKIVKKIKPANCWEENFNIDNIVGEPVTINNQRYNQFKVYQATYYPLNSETIDIPSVSLELIKYNVAKNPSFFGRNKQEDLKTFYSKAKKVSIKELPPHPLKESVSVGDYRLDEKISGKDLQTGESFNYTFSIVGEGNISAITEPSLEGDSNFDLYPPNIRQDIKRSNGIVRGVKSFNVYGIPNEPGNFDMSNYFSWVYFNTKKGIYDTLKSKMKLHVKGESKKNEYILSNDMGTFYDTMEFQDNELFALNENETTKIFANMLILLMLVVSAFVIFKK
jgi:hypothetical protein